MKYDSIINLPHYEPKYHKRMSKMQRAAQFNPFSALTGYDDMVKEVSRVENGLNCAALCILLILL